MARSAVTVLQVEATAVRRLLVHSADTRPALLRSLLAVLAEPVVELSPRPPALRLRGSGVPGVAAVRPDSPQLCALRFVHEAVTGPAFADALGSGGGVRALCRVLVRAPDAEQRLAAAGLRRLAALHAPARAVLEECLEPAVVWKLLVVGGAAELLRTLSTQFRGIKLRGESAVVGEGPASDAVGADGRTAVPRASAGDVAGADRRSTGFSGSGRRAGAGSGSPSNEGATPSEFVIENAETVRELQRLRPGRRACVRCNCVSLLRTRYIV